MSYEPGRIQWFMSLVDFDSTAYPKKKDNIMMMIGILIKFQHPDHDCHITLPVRPTARPWDIAYFQGFLLFVFESVYIFTPIPEK